MEKDKIEGETMKRKELKRGVFVISIILIAFSFLRFSINSTIADSLHSTAKGLQEEKRTASSMAYQEEYVKKEEIDSALLNRTLAMYPIGSIYISTSATNPSQYIGGQWQAYGQGRILLGVGTGSDKNGTQRAFSAGTTGGETTHVITATEMATHSHGSKTVTTSTANLTGTSLNLFTGYSTSLISKSPMMTFSRGSGRQYVSSSQSGNGWKFIDINLEHSHTASGNVAASGGNAAHNNMQPYIVAYIWNRTQ